MDKYVKINKESFKIKYTKSKNRRCVYYRRGVSEHEISFVPCSIYILNSGSDWWFVSESVFSEYPSLCV